MGRKCNRLTGRGVLGRLRFLRQQLHWFTLRWSASAAFPRGELSNIWWRTRAPDVHGRKILWENNKFYSLYSEALGKKLMYYLLLCTIFVRSVYRLLLLNIYLRAYDNLAVTLASIQVSVRSREGRIVLRGSLPVLPKLYYPE